MTHNEIFKQSFSMCERPFDPKETLMLLMVDKGIYYSWGITKQVNLQNKGLLLKVSANHHKGWVLITLGWEDLYKVKIISNNGKVLNEYEGIFFEDLVETIDNRIERLETYVV